MIKDYDKDTLKKALASNRKIYIYFYLKGCGPCKLLAPDIEEFAKYKEVYKVEGNQDKALQSALRVSGYPSLVIIENEVIYKNTSGINSIKQILNEYGESDQ